MEAGTENGLFVCGFRFCLRKGGSVPLLVEDRRPLGETLSAGREDRLMPQERGGPQRRGASLWKEPGKSDTRGMCKLWG